MARRETQNSIIEQMLADANSVDANSVDKGSVKDLTRAAVELIRIEGGRILQSLQLKDDGIDLNNIDWSRTNLEGLGIKMIGTCVSTLKAIIAKMPNNDYKLKMFEKIKTEAGLVDMIATIKHDVYVRNAALDKTPWAFEWFLTDDRKNNVANREMIKKAVNRFGYNIGHVLPDEEAGTICGAEDENLLDIAINSNPAVYETFVLKVYMKELRHLKANENTSHCAKLPVHDEAWREKFYAFVKNKDWMTKAIKRDYRVAWYLPDELKRKQSIIDLYNASRKYGKPVDEIPDVDEYEVG